jgi:hypothetical protein
MDEPKTGGIKSPRDYRDIYLAQATTPVTTPTTFFVDISLIPIENQRDIGCCVGCAAAKYKQVLDLRDTQKVIPLSFRFAYALAKCRDGYAGEGTYPRLVAKNFKDEGVPTEETCLNNTLLPHEEFVYSRLESNLPASAIHESYKGKIGGYAFVPIDIESIKQAIFQSMGCIMLVRTGKEWYTDKDGNRTYDKEKLLPIQPPKPIRSGHEVYVYGYREVGNDLEIHFINSWTKDWADRGTGYILFSQYKDFIDEIITFIDIPNSLLEEAHNKPKEFSYNFKKIIKIYERSDEVKKLQQALTMTGDFNFECTGFYGPITRDAILKFQLRETELSFYERFIMRGSVVGPKTLFALNNLFNK